MEAVAHEYLETTDPRKKGCPCGHPESEHPQPAEPKFRRRDLKLEEDTHRDVTYGICDPDYLIRRLMDRTLRQGLSNAYVPDPMLVQIGRNNPREAQEEIIDGAFYTEQSIEDYFEDERRYLLESALKKLHSAYDDIRRFLND